MTDNPFVYDGKPLATIGELLDAAYVIYKSGDQAEGQRFMAAYRAHTEHADVNIGYLAGYTGDMVEMLAFFDTSHPIFGRTSPTPDEAFAAGQRIGMERGSGA